MTTDSPKQKTTKIDTVSLRGSPSSTKSPEIKIYQHSDLIYWWPIWSYGYVCWAISFFLGKPVEIGGHKAVAAYEGSWLGISFTVLLMLIVTLTHMRPRGIQSVVILLVAVLLAIGLEYGYGWSRAMSLLSHLLIYMNAAFYAVVSTWALILWAISVFWIDRRSYWRFTRGQVVEHHQWDINNIYDTQGMVVTQLPDSLLLHKLIGFGTGELILKTTGATERQIVIENVWKVKKALRDIEELIHGR